MTIVDEVFDKATAIRRRWPSMPDERFRWRMDRASFDAIFEASLGPETWDVIENIPELAHIPRQERAERRERRRLHADAWGKPDNVLLGWRIVCDETMSGFEPEVVR